MLTRGIANQLLRCFCSCCLCVRYEKRSVSEWVCVYVCEDAMDANKEEGGWKKKKKKPKREGTTFFLKSYVIAGLIVAHLFFFFLFRRPNVIWRRACVSRGYSFARMFGHQTLWCKCVSMDPQETCCSRLHNGRTFTAKPWFPLLCAVCAAWLNVDMDTEPCGQWFLLLCSTWSGPVMPRWQPTLLDDECECVVDCCLSVTKPSPREAQKKPPWTQNKKGSSTRSD